MRKGNDLRGILNGVESNGRIELDCFYLFFYFFFFILRFSFLLTNLKFEFCERQLDGDGA